MLETLSFLKYFLLQGAGLVIAIVVAAIFLFIILRRLHSWRMTLLLFLFFFGTFLFIWVPIGLPQDISFPFALRTFGPSDGPKLPLGNVFSFFKHIDEYERVADIARDPNDVPPRPEPGEDGIIDIELTSKEVLAEMAPGITLNYWTYDGTVPGPMFRVREGDLVRVTLHNDPSSLHHHNVDFHSVTGPGGGAAATNVAPGESKSFTFRAMQPGLYVYHCAHTNVPNHMAHGMYGMMLVEPAEGLPEVDKEYYVMQGEFYTAGKLGTKGLQVIDSQKMLDGHAEYVVFNGRVGGVNDKMQANVGETVRMYVGNGGVNFISSFHVIGEIFDRVYPEGALRGAVHEGVQTTLVPAGGSTVVEFDLNVPGKFMLVDHALARLDRGAWGTLTAIGEAQADVFEAHQPMEMGEHGH
jgi:nitrite reductase (NO-forming)